MSHPNQHPGADPLGRNEPAPRRAFSGDQLDELDRVAPEVLTRGLPARLVGNVDALLRSDLDDRPWSTLLAAAACHDARRGDPLALELWGRAWNAFADTDDLKGMGLAANVRANIAFSHGEIAVAVTWWRRAEGLLGERGEVAIGAAAHGSLEAYARGDLAGAEERARDALLLADAAGVPGDAVVALVYLSLYGFCRGDIERSAQLLDRALAICSFDPARNETSLVLGFLGTVAALRGDQAESDRTFALALERADADGTPWYATMVRTLRADYTARWAPHRSLVDARRAQAETAALGDAWWHGLARYGEGAALAELGDLEGAREVLLLAIDELTNPFERGFAQLELGEVLLGLGDRAGARDVLGEARLAFESSGARWWVTRTSLAMGSAQRDRGGRWLRLARTMAADDPAYDRLFTPAQDLRIKVVGPPAVLLEGRQLEFLTRHAELATYFLAIAGPDGIAADELARSLWPDADPRRIGPRLRTLLWQVRNALGREAWRVQRHRDRVVLDLTGVDVDLHREALDRQEQLTAEGIAGAPVADRAAEPVGGGGGLEATTARPTPLVLLQGWDVELPPSLRVPA
jgi:tetratricopeptide (TPR) repeat protein